LTHKSPQKPTKAQKSYHRDRENGCLFEASKKYGCQKSYHRDRENGSLFEASKKYN